MQLQAIFWWITARYWQFFMIDVVSLFDILSLHFSSVEGKKQFSYIHKKKQIYGKIFLTAVQLKKIHLMTELFPFFFFFYFLSNSKKSISKLRIYFWDIFYANNLHTGNQVTGYNLQKIFLFSFFVCGWVGASSMCQGRDYSIKDIHVYWDYVSFWQSNFYVNLGRL